MADATTTAAKAYPMVTFALIDAPSGAQPNLPNLHWLTFDMRPGAYLAGTLAAGVSHAHVVGFVGGKDTPAQRQLLAAYRAGAQLQDSRVSVLERFAGDDGDQVTVETTGPGLDELPGGSHLLRHLRQ